MKRFFACVALSQKISLSEDIPKLQIVVEVTRSGDTLKRSVEVSGGLMLLVVSCCCSPCVVREDSESGRAPSWTTACSRWSRSRRCRSTSCCSSSTRTSTPYIHLMTRSARLHSFILNESHVVLEKGSMRCGPGAQIERTVRVCSFGTGKLTA